ncbi:MAG TPA: LuxR family transcriptional regulator, partial [Actinomycetota bacterium]|nr:LuxR family transcriptional regulator [Actinomycetota bacterium]
MEDAAGALDAARDAYRRHDWAGARDGFGAARAAGELAGADLDALADAAWWLGDFDQASAVLEEAYRRHLDDGRPGPAAMAAIGVAVNHFLRGDGVVGSGWLGRAQRLLRDQPEHTEHGYLLYLELEGALGGGDADAVVATAGRVREIGRRHADPNLVAGGDLFEGRALVKQGRMAEGMALLDEAMLAVLSGELDPGWAGNVYCHLMAAFHELADVRRAAEWTEATSRWVAALPPAVLFTGICRVHRSQVLERKGDWAAAEREAALVCRDLADLHVAGAAEGHYQLGDIRRLRGDLAGAEAAYRHAHELGRDPQPGLALLRLAQGRAATASASIRAALTAVTHDRLGRARLCAAQVEIALADGDAETAGRACDELTRTASTYGSSGL